MSWLSSDWKYEMRFLSLKAWSIFSDQTWSVTWDVLTNAWLLESVGPVGAGMDGENVRRDLAELVGGNRRFRETACAWRWRRSPRCVLRIVNELRNLAEVALRLKAGGNGVHDRGGRHRAQVVVAGEIEERFIAAVVDFRNPDGAADTAAGRVQAVLGAEARRVIAVLVDAPAGGFPDVAPHAVRPGAVEVVAAGAGGEDFDSAADAAVFRGVGADEQFDFAERLGGRRVENRAARFRDDVAGAVDQLFARAAGRSGDAGFAAGVHARHVAEKRRGILEPPAHIGSV